MFILTGTPQRRRGWMLDLMAGTTLSSKPPKGAEMHDYDEGFEQGRLVDQHYNPPTGEEPEEYIQGWVDGRMEQIRYEDPATADKFEAIFLGAEGFGKATYRKTFVTPHDTPALTLVATVVK